MGYLIVLFAGVAAGWCTAALVIRGRMPQCADCETERRSHDAFCEEEPRRAVG
jgi:hypothetical protein